MVFSCPLLIALTSISTQSLAIVMGPYGKTGPGTLSLTGPGNETGQMPGACIPQQALMCETLLTDGLRPTK